MKRTLLGLLVASALAGCGGNGEGDGGQAAEATAAGTDAPSAPRRLDCGQGPEGSKRALRQFIAVLRGGDEDEVLALLARPGRFEWISASDARGPDLSVKDDRVKAAKAVAARGGLPMRITRFQNAEAPRATTDLGFVGIWEGDRHLNGKAALDCRAGKARVLSVGIPP